MSGLTILNQDTFNELKNTNSIILIDFWATWCPPCKVMGPIFEKLSQDPDFAGLQFVECDVDENPEVSGLFKISSIPTFSVVKFSGDGSFELDKNKVGEIIGSMNEPDFKNVLLKLAEKAGWVKTDLNQVEEKAVEENS